MRGLWHFEDFRNVFLPNTGEDQKKSHHLSAEPLASTVPFMVNPALVIALYVHKKVNEGLTEVGTRYFCRYFVKKVPTVLYSLHF